MSDLGRLLRLYCLCCIAVLDQLHAGDVHVHCLASNVVVDPSNNTGYWCSGVLDVVKSTGGSIRLELNTLWLGTRQQVAKLDLIAIAANFPHIAFSVNVRY